MSIERLLVVSEIEVRDLDISRHDNFFAFARSIQYGTCIAHEVSHDKFSNDVHIDYSKGWAQNFSHQFSDIWNKCLSSRHGHVGWLFDPIPFIAEVRNQLQVNENIE